MERLIRAAPRLIRGVATWMRGRPATCCMWMRGPAMSVRPVSMTRRMWASASCQLRWRISVVPRGTLEDRTTVSMSRSWQASTMPSTVGRAPGASALGGRLMRCSSAGTGLRVSGT